jgi:hypothetical protein
MGGESLVAHLVEAEEQEAFARYLAAIGGPREAACSADWQRCWRVLVQADDVPTPTLRRLLDRDRSGH